MLGPLEVSFAIRLLLTLILADSSDDQRQHVTEDERDGGGENSVDDRKLLHELSSGHETHSPIAPLSSCPPFVQEVDIDGQGAEICKKRHNEELLSALHHAETHWNGVEEANSANEHETESPP